MHIEFFVVNQFEKFSVKIRKNIRTWKIHIKLLIGIDDDIVML